MTYCVGVMLDAGLVLASDTRTNAGVDNVAVFRKMSIFEVPGKRVITLCSAGNLAITQAAINVISEWRGGEDKSLDIDRAKSMFRVARIVGEALREVHRTDAEHLRKHNADFIATFLLGGQIKGERPRLFMVYGAGNFIEATPETPFFQIGETKYGKPVFDRLLSMGMSLEEATKLVLISFDSTMRSNLSVALPIDLMCYETDKLKVTHLKRLQDGDTYLMDLRRQWGEGLRKVFEGIKPPVL